MNVVAWILQILLGLVFLVTGGTKIVGPKPALVSSGMGFAEDFSDSSVKGIGGIEVIGAIGLILPWLLGVSPILTPLAALGLALVMTGAVVVHVWRKEQFAVPLVLGLLSLVLAVIRFLPA